MSITNFTKKYHISSQEGVIFIPDGGVVSLRQDGAPLNNYFSRVPKSSPTSMKYIIPWRLPSPLVSLPPF